MKKIFKESIPTLQLIAAVILGIIVIPLGLIWAFGKPFYDNFKSKRSPKDAFIWFLRYWINIFIQIIYVISYFLDKLVIILKMIFFEFRVWAGFKYLEHTIAIVIDLFGNVTSGELIEDCVTTKENTLYGNGKYTISAATGYLLIKNFLNKTGLWFSSVLDKFEEDHCRKAYLYEFER